MRKLLIKIAEKYFPFKVTTYDIPVTIEAPEIVNI